MPRQTPSPAQDFASSVLLPILSVLLLPFSLVAILGCVVHDKVRRRPTASGARLSVTATATPTASPGCVIISGGRMSKGLTLARAFKRGGWEVVGVEEVGWGELCPLRHSSAIDHFYLLPEAATSYTTYAQTLLSIAQRHKTTLFIPVSGAGSSVQDARAAEEMYKATDGTCRTFIQDEETMHDLHDKDLFMALVERLGMATPKGQVVKSVAEAVDFLAQGELLAEKGSTCREPVYVLKCLGLDENRGDMTLFPLEGDDEDLSSTRQALERLNLAISADCPYVFQEFIPGQEYCTHASVVKGAITSFVTCPSNDMLMTYEDLTASPIGQQAEAWTADFLRRLKAFPRSNSGSGGKERGLTGHFSFDFILSTKDGQMYPLECNARVHTAVILLPLDQLAHCYNLDRRATGGVSILRPLPDTRPRTWIYNDLIMRYLPRLITSPHVLHAIHPSLPACLPSKTKRLQPSEDPWMWRVDPTLVADDWVPFLVLWHVWWPALLLKRWWQGKRWTRVSPFVCAELSLEICADDLA